MLPLIGPAVELIQSPLNVSCNLSVSLRTERLTCVWNLSPCLLQEWLANSEHQGQVVLSVPRGVRVTELSGTQELGQRDPG